MKHETQLDVSVVRQVLHGKVHSKLGVNPLGMLSMV